MISARTRRTPARLARTAAAIAIVAAVAVGCSSNNPAPSASGPTTATTPNIEGLQTFQVPSRNHVSTPVAYPQTPPVGGDHAPVWQNCGAYAAPIPTEQGVHSMEHGAVWITYRPDVDAATREALENRARNGTYLLVSPWPDGLPAKVVASAWGAQLKLDSATDPRLDAFITAYRQSLSAPEPGAPCTGGKSNTK